MITVQGTHNSAVCYTDTLEKSAAGQIKAACDELAFRNMKLIQRELDRVFLKLVC